jgi:hypothetical protein
MDEPIDVRPAAPVVDHRLPHVIQLARPEFPDANCAVFLDEIPQSIADVVDGPSRGSVLATVPSVREVEE